LPPNIIISKEQAHYNPTNPTLNIEEETSRTPRFQLA